MFCLNFAFSELLPFISILRQLESVQNVRFYLNLTQYVMYPSAYHSGLILTRFGKLQNIIRNFNSAFCMPANNGFCQVHN